MKSFCWLIGLLRPAALQISLGLFLACLSIGSNIGLMAAAGWLIATAAFHPPLYELSLAIIGVRFFGIARACFRYGERYLSHDATFRVLARLRVLYYQALEKMPQLQFEKKCRGALIERMVGDIEILQYFYLRVLAPIVIAIIILGLSGCYLFMVDAGLLWEVLVILILGAVVLPFGIYHWQQHTDRGAGEIKEAIKNQVTDIFAGTEEVAAFQLGYRYQTKIGVLCQDLCQEQIKVSQVSAVLEGLSSLTLQLAGCASLFFLVCLLENCQISAVDIVVLYLVITSSLESAVPLFLLPHFGESSLKAAERLKVMLKETPSTKKTGLSVESYGLVLQDVFVSYDAEEPALRGVNITVPFGRKIAVVGASGAGKTTLLKALLSLVDYQGSITLGGQEMAKYSPEAIHQYISVVDQNTFLFSATIEENIRMARPDAAPEEIVAAIGAAGAADFIKELEENMQTRVGHFGLALSGGQRQRIALARAYLKNAPILVLDEPTAGLDAVTARIVIKQALQNSTQTVFLITHWLCDLSDMDEIIVLEHGKIIEQGTESQLINKRGAFYQMRQIQWNMI